MQPNRSPTAPLAVCHNARCAVCGAPIPPSRSGSARRYCPAPAPCRAGAKLARTAGPNVAPWLAVEALARIGARYIVTTVDVRDAARSHGAHPLDLLDLVEVSAWFTPASGGWVLSTLGVADLAEEVLKKGGRTLAAKGGRTSAPKGGGSSPPPAPGSANPAASALLSSAPTAPPGPYLVLPPSQVPDGGGPARVRRRTKPWSCKVNDKAAEVFDTTVDRAIESAAQAGEVVRVVTLEMADHTRHRSAAALDAFKREVAARGGSLWLVQDVETGEDGVRRPHWHGLVIGGWERGSEGNQALGLLWQRLSGAGGHGVHNQALGGFYAFERAGGGWDAWGVRITPGRRRTFLDSNQCWTRYCLKDQPDGSRIDLDRDVLRTGDLADAWERVLDRLGCERTARVDLEVASLEVEEETQGGENLERQSA